MSSKVFTRITLVSCCLRSSYIIIRVFSLNFFLPEDGVIIYELTGNLIAFLILSVVMLL